MADQIASAREEAERKRKEKIAELRKKAKAVRLISFTNLVKGEIIIKRLLDEERRDLLY